MELPDDTVRFSGCLTNYFGRADDFSASWCIILVPLVTAATSNIDPLLMIHHGSYISATSVFFLVVSTSIWSSIAFVIALSIGDAIWSPRLYDYTIGCLQGGSGRNIRSVGIGTSSILGQVTHRFHERLPIKEIFWLIIGLTTAISPILMTMFGSIYHTGPWRRYSIHRNTGSGTGAKPVGRQFC